MSFDVTGEDLFKLLLALIIGGIIGAEREFRDKAAGVRTMSLICVGSTLFTMFSIRLSDLAIAPNTIGDPTRIASYIVAGIGFLGGGVIIRHGGEVKGLTTAATIWVAAALGIGIGAGEYAFCILSLVAIIVVLLVLRPLEGWIESERPRRKNSTKN